MSFESNCSASCSIASCSFCQAASCSLVGRPGIGSGLCAAKNSRWSKSSTDGKLSRSYQCHIIVGSGGKKYERQTCIFSSIHCLLGMKACNSWFQCLASTFVTTEIWKPRTRISPSSSASPSSFLVSCSPKLSRVSVDELSFGFISPGLVSASSLATVVLDVVERVSSAASMSFLLLYNECSISYVFRLVYVFIKTWQKPRKWLGPSL